MCCLCRCQVELFTDLNPQFVNGLVRRLTQRTYVPGEVLCRQGEEGHEMYFLRKGQVSVLIQGVTRGLTYL